MQDVAAPAPLAVGTLNAPRWIVRVFSFTFYPLFIPMLWEFFLRGLTPRSLFYFLFFGLGVYGLHIGWRASDAWVNAWVSATTAMLLAFSLLFLLLPTLVSHVFLFPFERHILTFLTLLSFLLLGSWRMVPVRRISLVPPDPTL